MDAGSAGQRPQWRVAEQTVIDGVELSRGDAVKVDGLRGSFAFRAHVVTETTEWVEVYGGTAGREKSRSFITGRVHPRKERRR